MRGKKTETFDFARISWVFIRFASYLYGEYVGMCGFVGYPEISIFLPTNEIFSQKRQFSTFQKRPFLRLWCRKIDFCENGCIDMAYIMDSGQKTLHTTFPNIFSWKSAILADLFKKNEIYHISEKSCHFQFKKSS